MKKQTWISLLTFLMAIAIAITMILLHRISDDVFLDNFDYENIPSLDNYQKDINDLLKNIEINEETGRKNILLFVTNSGYEQLTRNALCSLMRTNVAKERIVVLAFDEESYASMRNLGVKTLLYPKSDIPKYSVTLDNNKEIINIIKAKFDLVQTFIDKNVDVSVIDSDIIFTQNPFLALNLDNDLDISINEPNEPKIPFREPYYLGANLGLYHVASSPQMKKFLAIWKSHIENSDTFEQGALYTTIKSMNVKTIGEDSLIISSPTLSDSKEDSIIKLRYINPLFGIQSIGPIKGNVRKFVRNAKMLNLSAPYWCHFNGLGDSQSKEKRIKDMHLWYLDSAGKCRKKAPYGNSWPWWR